MGGGKIISGFYFFDICIFEYKNIRNGKFKFKINKCKDSRSFI